MRAIIPLTLALLSAGAEARALTHCNHYCKSIFWDQQVSLRPDCNCSLISWKVNRNSPQLAPRHIYEPSKGDPAVRQNYPQSFLTTLPKHKYYADKHNQPKYRRRVSNETHSDHKENVFKIDIEAEGLPIYLDIDIHRSKSQRRISDSVLKTRLNYLEATENIVSDCLNLHNVAHVRRQNVTDFKNKLNSKIIDRYKNISELDLQAKMKENCKIPANIIHEARNEIKEKIFVKRNRSVKDITTERHEKQFGVKTDILYEKSGEPVTISSVEETEILDRSTENIENTYFNLVSRTQFTEVTENSHVNNNMESTRSTTILDEASNQSTDEGRTVSLVSPLAALTSDETTTIKYDATDLTDYIVKNDGQDYETKNEETKYLVSKNNEFTSAQMESIALAGDMKHHELLKHSNNIRQLEFSTTSAYTSQLIMSTISPEANVTDNSYLNSDYADMDSSLSKNDVVSRSKYNEGQNTIPSIVTKEYSNDTVISNVGIEYSSDFGHDSIRVNNSSKHVSSLASTETDCVSENCSTNLKSDSEVENTHSDESDSAKEITGELFFQYDHQHIPARFVQHADGKINMALDGDLMCKHSRKSMLMTALCNRMQSHNCTISQ